MFNVSLDFCLCIVRFWLLPFAQGILIEIEIVYEFYGYVFSYTVVTFVFYNTVLVANINYIPNSCLIGGYCPVVVKYTIQIVCFEFKH